MFNPTVGGWTIDVNTSGMPQSVATAMADLEILGATYTSIAYLGSQDVKGAVKHAVLASQTITDIKGTTNIVILEFLEKDGKTTLVSIDPVLSEGGQCGGTEIDVKTDIPKSLLLIFNKVMEGFVGSKVVPFAYLGSQVTTGVDYIFAATVTAVTPDAETTVALVSVNPLTKEITFQTILG